MTYERMCTILIGVIALFAGVLVYQDGQLRRMEEAHDRVCLTSGMLIVVLEPNIRPSLADSLMMDWREACPKRK